MIGGSPDGTEPRENAVVKTDGGSGTLIARDIVLSAGHTLPWPERFWEPEHAVGPPENSSSEHTNPGAWIDLEDWSDGTRTVFVTRPDGGEPIAIAVEAINKPGSADIVLLGLAEPVPLDLALPIGVLTTERPWGKDGNPTDYWRDRRFRMAGWGETESGALTDVRLSAGARDGRFPTSSRYTNKISVTGDGGAATRNGDSGGPLLWKDTERSEVVIGVNQSEGNIFVATFGTGGQPTVGDTGHSIHEPNVARWLRLHSQESYASQIERSTRRESNERITLYSWWNKDLGDNLTTTDEGWIGNVGWGALGDRRSILEAQRGTSPPHLENRTWSFVTRAADVFSPNRAMPAGAVRLWRWWSRSRGDTRTTSDPILASPAENPETPNLPHAIHGLVFPHPDYECIRLEGYIFDPNLPQPPGTIALYTYYSPERNDHHLTAAHDMRHRDYRLVRTEGYAFPASPRPTIRLT